MPVAMDEGEDSNDPEMNQWDEQEQQQQNKRRERRKHHYVCML